jgi:hypothetical protein
MSLVTAQGSFVTAGALRRGSILDGVVGLGSLVVVVLPVVGLLLLALVLIITGCGPPN